MTESRDVIAGSSDRSLLLIDDDEALRSRLARALDQRVFELCDRNVSETARRLNMHRRTLQRVLAKRSPQ